MIVDDHGMAIGNGNPPPHGTVANGNQRKPTEKSGHQRKPTSADFHWLSSKFIDFHLFRIGCPRYSMVFIDSDWCSLVFIDFRGRISDRKNQRPTPQDNFRADPASP